MKRFVLAAFLFVFCAAPLLAANVDTVFTMDGKSKKVEITKMSANELTVDDSGVEEKIPVNLIKYVSFNNEPTQFKTARSYMENGSNEDALEMLKKIDPSSISNSKAMVQELDYLKAKATAGIALGGGEITKENAAAVAMDFAKKNANSFHFYEMCEQAGDLCASLNTAAGYKQATALYEKMQEAPSADMKMRSSVNLGRIFLAQKNTDGALKVYEQVLQNKERGDLADRQRLIATMGKAKCLALSGKTDEAQKMVTAVLKNSDPEDTSVNAQGYNTLGLAYRAANKDKEAIVAFLQVDMLYYRDVPCHIEALQNLESLWRKLEMPNRALDCVEKLKAYGVN